MTDHTEDVREIASVPLLSALHDLAVRIPGLAGDCHCNLVAEVVLDALLPAVTPVIRQQVAEEIAWAIEHPIGPQEVRWAPIARRWMAESAAIARSHALPETGEDHG